jgi:TetR/AcrR family transcriptional regulator, mexCD-oprJ operon repressor
VADTRTKRADAQRSIAAILDAAVECLSRKPDASIGEIAQTAGVGRVTLYGHFPSRADLVEAALARAIEDGHAALDAVDLTGDPRKALARLIESSWMLVDRFRSLLLAAQATLPPGRIRTLHTEPMERVHRLIERGQAEDVFRTDLPASWLVGTMHSVMHGAADEINAGRLAADEAAGYITATLLAAFTPPGRRIPAPQQSAYLIDPPDAPRPPPRTGSVTAARQKAGGDQSVELRNADGQQVGGLHDGEQRIPHHQRFADRVPDLPAAPPCQPRRRNLASRLAARLAGRVSDVPGATHRHVAIPARLAVTAASMGR